MNKKALFTYVILLIIVVVVSYYIRYYGFIGGTTIRSTTSVYANTTQNGIQQTRGQNITISNSTTSLNSGNASQCSSAPEYACYNVSFNSTTGNMSVTFAQYTGIVWRNARIFFLNQSEIADVSSYSSYSSSGYLLGYADTGQLYTAKIGDVRPSGGRGISGQIWASYEANGSVVYYGLVANVSLGVN